MDELLEYFRKQYPDEMVLDKVDEFDRVKLVGKVELLKEIARWYEDEYGTKLGKQS